MSKKKGPTYYLRARSYAQSKLNFVSVWLIHDENGVTSWMLWGEVLPQVVDEIAAATGLPVQHEESELVNVKPVEMKRAACATVDEQKSLFE